jgi:hypothetical protein
MYVNKSLMIGLFAKKEKMDPKVSLKFLRASSLPPLINHPPLYLRRGNDLSSLSVPSLFAPLDLFPLTKSRDKTRQW